MTPAEIAAVCHEANRAYCAAHGDFSQAPWAEAPKWQKDSALAGVKHALAYPGLTSEESHRGWMALKFEEGWRYGPTKDVEAKLHPCMRPYGELPAEQRAKDALFLGIVRALAHMAVQ